MADGMAHERAAIAVTARSLDDYRGMFDLDDDAFTNCSFVDCASGASAFGAELRARGGQAWSVDPLYATGLQGVRQRALYNLANCEQWLLANADVINWQHVRSPGAYRHAGLNSLEAFGVDFVAHPTWPGSGFTRPSGTETTS